MLSWAGGPVHVCGWGVHTAAAWLAPSYADTATACSYFLSHSSTERGLDVSACCVVFCMPVVSNAHRVAPLHVRKQGSGKELIQPVLDNQLKAASPLVLPPQVCFLHV